MIYIIYGTEPYLINNKLNEIVKENSDSSIVKYNGLDKSFSINELLDTVTSVDLFSNKSLILLKDPIFLIKKVDEKEIDAFLEYCHKPIYENTLVMYTLDNSFNTRLKIFNDISLNAQVIILDKIKNYDFFNYAKGEINNRKLNITKDAINTLINSVNYDLSLLNNNLDILALYPEQIDTDVVKKLISYPSEEDTFNLINALTSKKISKSIKLANTILESDGSVLRLISTLANQLRFLYMVSYYNSNHFSMSELIKITGAKEYRIKKALETLTNLSDIEILKLESKLADLDYLIKTQSDIDERMYLNLFIVSELNK